MLTTGDRVTAREILLLQRMLIAALSKKTSWGMLDLQGEIARVLGEWAAEPAPLADGDRA